MLFRALDSSDDWTFGKGKQNLLTGKDAMMLNLKTRLKEWRNDCFFNLDAGVDYNNLLDIGTKDLLDKDIIVCILGSDSVIRIDSYTSTIVDRTLNIEATLLTAYGTVALSEVI